MGFKLTNFSLLLLVSNVFVLVSCNQDMVLQSFLDSFDKKLLNYAKKLSLLYWEYSLNMTGPRMDFYKELYFKSIEDTKNDLCEMRKLDWTGTKDEEIKRKWLLITQSPAYLFKDSNFTEFLDLVLEMKRTFLLSNIISYDKKSANMDISAIIETFATSRSHEILSSLWTTWFKFMNDQLTQSYKKYLEMAMFIARTNNFNDMNEFWLSTYSTPHVDKGINALWKNISLFYKQVHAYVRFCLQKEYGNIVSEKGPIPIHLVGTIWGRSFEQLYEITEPYPTAKIQYLEDILTPKKMFLSAAARMFKYYNLPDIKDDFWEKSVFEGNKQYDKIDCTSEIVDMYSNGAYRLRSCLLADYKNYLLVHKLLGSLAYKIAYSKQHFVYRKPCHPSFYEGLTSLFSVMAQNPSYMAGVDTDKIAEVEDEAAEHDYKSNINWLWYLSLHQIPRLAFYKAFLDWRRLVMAKRIKPNEYNCKWWELIEENQGLEPPVDRTSTDFDPVCYPEVISDNPYYDKFIGMIFSYQIFREICSSLEEYTPGKGKLLHRCNLLNKQELPSVIIQTMAYGASKNWSDLFYLLTGETVVQMDGILEYFQPIIEWLVKTNKQNKNYIGWKNSQRKCKTV